MVLGAGPAGVTAAIYAVRSGLDTVIVAPDFGGQILMTEIIENWPGFERISGIELAKKYEDHLKSYKEIEIVENDFVTKLEKVAEDHFVATTNDGTKVEAKTVIIASGKSYKKIFVPGAQELENKGLHYCALCDAPLYKGKPVAVIGVDYYGTQEALYVSQFCSKVYLIHKGKELEGEQITKETVLAKDNIEKIFNVETTQILGQKFVEGLKYKDLKSGEEKTIEVKAVFVNVGRSTNADFIDVEKNEHGEIIVNEKNETSIPGVYAAGEITNYPVYQLVTSAGEGCKAALYVADYLKHKKKS